MHKHILLLWCRMYILFCHYTNVRVVRKNMQIVNQILRLYSHAMHLATYSRVLPAHRELSAAAFALSGLILQLAVAVPVPVVRL